MTNEARWPCVRSQIGTRHATLDRSRPTWDTEHIAPRWGDEMNLARLVRFFADEARMPARQGESCGEYVISDYALNQVDWELNFTPQRMAVDTVLDEV